MNVSAQQQLSRTSDEDYFFPTGLRKRYLDEETSKYLTNLRREAAVPLNLDTLLDVPGPDIQWNPSFATYQQRVSALSKLRTDRPTSVPAGFPAKVDAPWMWDGSEFSDENEFVFHLGEEDIDEIEQALSSFKGGDTKIRSVHFQLTGGIQLRENH
jgi:hypothetical protein